MNSPFQSGKSRAREAEKGIEDGVGASLRREAPFPTPPSTMLGGGKQPTLRRKAGTFAP